MTGIAVEKLSDAQKVLEEVRKLLPVIPSDKLWLPYLGGTLDAGIATLWAEEVIEAIKYIDGPSPVEGNFYCSLTIFAGTHTSCKARSRSINKFYSSFSYDHVGCSTEPYALYR